MTLSNDSLNQILLFFGKRQKQLHFVVVVLLSLYLIAFAAELTWKLIPPPDLPAAERSARSAEAHAQSSGSRTQVNIAEIKRLNLFGELGAEPVVEEETVTDAPETNLNLTLAGVVAYKDPEKGK